MWDLMKKNPIAVGVVTLIAVVVLAIIVFIAIPSGDDDDEGTASSDKQTQTQQQDDDEEEDTSPKRGFIPAVDLEVGDCVRNAKGEGGDGVRFKAVNCARRHGGQVFTILKVFGTKYPGKKAVAAKGQRGCRARMRRKYPATFNDPTSGFTFVYPTQETWDSGFHQITCIAAFGKKKRGELTI